MCVCVPHLADVMTGCIVPSVFPLAVLLSLSLSPLGLLTFAQNGEPSMIMAQMYSRAKSSNKNNYAREGFEVEIMPCIPGNLRDHGILLFDVLQIFFLGGWGGAFGQDSETRQESEWMKRGK